VLEVCVTYKTGIGLDDWIYWHLIHTTRIYRQYSAISDLHTLQFTVTHALGSSVFTSRILATDLSQSHSHFRSDLKSSFHPLIHSLPFLLNHLGLPSPELDQIHDSNSLKWILSTSDNKFKRFSLSLYNPPGTDHAENTASLLFRRLVYRFVA
jgi:hypothetical protein